MTPGPDSVLIRVDASRELGTGHLMRCRTLARALRASGATVRFLIGGAGSTDIAALVVDDGFEARFLPNRDGRDLPCSDDLAHTLALLADIPDVRLVIVDHYGLGEAWEAGVAAGGATVAVIDDLADRQHACDVLVDQNLYDDMAGRYAGLVPPACRLLLGPRWALLRDEFAAARERSRMRDGRIRSVLVSYGGSDPTNETVKAVAALVAIPTIERIDVVVGRAATNLPEVRAIAERDERVRVHAAVEDMASLMAAADLALGAGGATTWERCSLALPAVVTTVAANQEESARALAARGAILYLGASESVQERDIERVVRDLAADPSRVAELSRRSGAIMDDLGGAPAVAEAMLEVARAES